MQHNLGGANPQGIFMTLVKSHYAGIIYNNLEYDRL